MQLLPGIDVNLVPLLHALLEEAHVARAARRVGLSSSAASHGLSRLRLSLEDPLLVRSGRGLVRTTRAERIRPLVQRAVDELGAIWRASERVDPATLCRVFRLFAADDVRGVLFARLDAALSREAPAVDVHGLPFGPGVLDRLAANEADLAVAVFRDLPESFATLPVYTDRLVAVARLGHPCGSAELDAPAFAALTHILVSPLGGRRGLVDDLLDASGLQRRVARVVPTFFDALDLVATRDQVACLPERFVRANSARYGVRELRVALPLPTFAVRVAWHARHDADPAHRWFRERLSRIDDAPGR
ncbi:MAG: LysR family transcriptional regulator [Deltaproteobacteria bacterium]|nr:LysR family transcriptional regulator [Deltaproteobacteria bacterium]